jgi:hypothetical protein
MSKVPTLIPPKARQYSTIPLSLSPSPMTLDQLHARFLSGSKIVDLTRALVELHVMIPMDHVEVGDGIVMKMCDLLLLGTGIHY